VWVETVAERVLVKPRGVLRLDLLETGSVQLVWVVSDRTQTLPLPSWWYAGDGWLDDASARRLLDEAEAAVRLASRRRARARVRAFV